MSRLWSANKMILINLSTMSNNSRRTSRRHWTLMSDLRMSFLGKAGPCGRLILDLLTPSGTKSKFSESASQECMKFTSIPPISYMLATELHAHLDDLSGSLTQMIDSVNALSLTPNGSQGMVGNDDPMLQISQILSSHLDSLQWIDGAVREVEGKVNEVEKRVREAGGVSTIMGSGATKSRGFGLNR